MLSINPIALASGILAEGMNKFYPPLKRTMQKKMLIDRLRPPMTATNIEPELTNINEHLTQQVVALDRHFQHFIQKHIDPLLISDLHNEQIKVIATAGMIEISEEEKQINRHLGLGLTGMAVLGLAHLTLLPLIPLAIGIGLYLSLPLYKIAWQRAVYDRQLRLSHLLALYTTGMWLGGAYLIGMIGTLIYTINRKVLTITESRARHRVIDVFGQQPRTAWVLVDGVEVEHSFDQVQIGDTLILDAGQVVPIDGRIIEGNALVDQHMLTGEGQPAEKGVGDVVQAATVVLGGRIFVCVEKTGDETTAAQIGSILNQTATQRAAMEMKAIEIANQSLLPMLIASGLTGLLWGAGAAITMLGCNYMINMMALGPLAMLNLVNAASQRRILLKDGQAIERLVEIDTIVFDKTGTLTLDCPHVVQIITCAELTENELLRLVAAAEQRQTHPIAQAILALAEERQVTIPRIDEAHYEIGAGIKVTIAEQTIQVGSERFMQMNQLILPAVLQAHKARCHDQGYALVFVAVDAQVVGALELHATMRPEAKQVVHALRTRNIELCIISGDAEAPTQKLATDLGISRFFANTLPERKADLVAALQSEGRRVCFIGDGINDAIALRTADVSISLRGATTAATDTAQIILMDGDLAQLPTLFDLAQQFNTKITRNLQNAGIFSLLGAGSVFFLGLGYVGVEVLAAIQFATGLRIANQPLAEQKSERS
jgi:heavy metal translocating P-type ATPase